MKQTTNNYTRRSSKLLLALCVWIAGAATAMAQGYTCGFESADGWTSITSPGDGWSIQGGAGDLILSSSTNYRHSGSYGLYWSDTGTNTSHYVVSPKLAAGTVKFYARGRASSSNGSVKVFVATENGDSYTIGTDNLCTSCNNSTGDLSHSTWKEFSFTLTADAHVAFLLYRAAIDDISAPAGLAEAAATGLQVKDGTATIASPFSYDFGLTTAGTVKTFTLKNLDNANALGISVTASDFNDAVSTSIAAGGTYDLTFTMPSATVAAEAVTVTPAEGEAFTFNLSGTVKDPSKFFFDFSDAEHSFPATWTVDENWVLSEDGYIENNTASDYDIISSRIKVNNGGEKIFLKHYGTVYDGGTMQYSYIKVYTSTDAATWTQAGETIATEQAWGTSSVDIPATAKYIKITGKRVRIDDFYGLEADDAASYATLTFTADDYDFGIVTENTTTAAYTISNTGNAELTGLKVTVNGSSAFTVSVKDNATKIAADGGEATFTVTMSPATPGVHTATINITSDNGGEASFKVSGVVMKDGMTTIDFNDNQLPARWTQGSTAWTFAEGAAKGVMLYSVYATMTTPKLQFADGDFVVFKAKNSNDNSGSLLVEGSADGTDFTAYSKEFALTADYANYVATIPTTVKYLRLTGKYALVDEITGLAYAAELVVTKDGETVASGTTVDFGDLSANQTATYTFANAANEGSISITGVTSDNAVFTTNWTEATAVPFNLVITANYNAANEGEQTGKVTVTTTEGTFDINVTTNILPASQPKMAFFLGEDVTESATGAKIDFGMVENGTKTISIKNEGTGALSITAITVPTGFTLKQGTADVGTSLSVAANSTAVLTLAMDGAGAHSGTLSFKADGFDEFTFALSGHVIDNTKMLVNFDDNQMPAGWLNSGWTIADGTAKANTSGADNSVMTTPALIVADGEQLALSIKKGEGNTTPELYYYASADGEQWNKSENVAAALTTDYTLLYIKGLPTTAKYLKLEGYNVVIDVINGLELNNNAPAFGVYTTTDFTEANKAEKTQDIDFGFTDGTAKSFFFTNTGTGTLVLSKPVAAEPVSATVTYTKDATLNGDNYEIAAGGYVKLEISLPVTAAAGVYTDRAVTMAAKDAELGAFTATVSGVVADAAKFNLDFTNAATTIPSDWTAGNWVKNGDNKFISVSGYASSNELTSTPMIAQANEPLVVVAKTNYSGSLAVNYRAEDAEGWSVLRAAAATTGSDFETIVLAMPSEIDNTKRYLLQFVGTNDAQIQRIYGLTEPMEPKMEVKDGTDVIAGSDNSYDFGNVTEATDKVFTVANPGKSTLSGLKAELSGDGAADYSVSLSATSVAAKGEAAIITVTQKFDAASLGSHSAVLTISADGMTPVVVSLSGRTRDGAKQYIDFSSTAWPDNWKQTGWNIYSGQAYRASDTESAIITAPLQVKKGETLLFDAGRYSTRDDYQPSLKIRYTKDGGLTWSEYQDYSSQLAGQTTTELSTYELAGVAADADALAVVEISGAAVRLDNIYGGVATTAPMMAVTADGEAVENGAAVDFGNLTSDATAVYTITNNGSADLVSTITATVVTAEISGDDITVEGNKVTVPAGKSAIVTVTQKFEAPYGAKAGNVTIESEGWIADFTIGFTATLVDPAALYVNFDDNAKPAGWFSDSWTFTNGYAQASNISVTELITEQYEATADKNTASFEAWQTSTSQFVTKKLTVYTSEDRMTWSQGQELTLTNERQTITLPAMTVGKKYYVKFEGQYVAIDNFTGLAKITPAPEHDMYLAAATLPTESAATPGRMIPGTEYTATVKVASLRADETVKAELYFNSEKKAELAAETVIANGETKELTLTAAVPETEGTYDVYVKVYSDFLAVETTKVQLAAEHTRQLAVATFSRVMADGEAEQLAADNNNQISPAFAVTVSNQGSVALVPTVKIMQGETVVGTQTAAAVAAGETSEVITVGCAGTSAGEGGELTFTAVVEWTAKDGTTATANMPANMDGVTIIVVAAAPKFVMTDGTNVMNDGDAVNYGIQKSATKKTFVIRNEGNKALELVSVTAPAGYDVTAITADNKTVAVNGALDIDVTLKAEQGKAEGNLVITYKVDSNNESTFTLALNGRSVSTDTWVEEFATGIPTTWTNDGWTYDSDNQLAYSGPYDGKFSLVTPRLKAAKDEVLTYDAKWKYDGDNMTVEYSTDNKTWTAYATVSSTTTASEQQFVAPAADSYYLRFTANRYVQLDNFVGFQLNPLAHDVAVTSLTLPANMNQYAWYDIEVALQEKAGKQETVTATLYWNGTIEDGIADSERSKMTTTLQPNGSGKIAFSFQPQWSADNGIPMYLVLSYGDASNPMTVQTETVEVVSAAAPVIDEENQTEDEIATFANKAVMWKHQWTEGWNTMCVPFAFENTNYAFGDRHFYEFDGYDAESKAIRFKTVTALKAGKPYIYTATSSGSIRTIIQDVSVNYGLATPDKVTYNGVTFQGSYARMDAGSMEDKWYVAEVEGKAGTLKGDTEATMKGFRAYFTGITELLPDLTSLRIYLDDEVVTGIDALRMAGQLGALIYDMNGQRVENPKKGGIYIVNGKTVVIK